MTLRRVGYAVAGVAFGVFCVLAAVAREIFERLTEAWT